MIDQQVIDRILYSVDIVTEIESAGVKLKEAGANFKGCCPFHNEKTPSFVVSQAKGIFKCFGCNEAGNVIHFVQKYRNMNFPQAVEYLAEKHNIEYQKREMSPEERERVFKREQLFTINKVALDYFVQSFRASETAQKYARGRWSDETIEGQQIGYAPESWTGLIDYAEKLGYKQEVLLDAGLISVGNRGAHDFFYGRLIFPIRNMTGNIIGFSGRVFSAKDVNRKVPKYINTRETEIFHKEENLFGFFEARREIRRTQRINLVEGNPDVIRMFERKILNTAAPLGTALTSKQIELVKAEAKSVVLIGDTDAAGIIAVLKNGEALFRAGLSVSVMQIPEGKDPDEYFKDTMNDYRECLENHTVDYIDYYAANKFSEVASTADKAAVIRDICDLLTYHPDESAIDMYVDSMAKTYGARKTWIQIIGELRNKRQMGERIKANRTNEEMWAQFGIIEENNCYISYGKNGSGNQEWSNFTMKPLAHIRSMTNSKRLYLIKNKFGMEQTVELKQEELVSLAKFRVRVESMGNYLWLATETELFRLKNYLYLNTETCDEITQLGWQRQYGFFAWGNGGVVDGKFIKADEIGILRVGNRAYYLPAFSKIFADEMNLFQFERRFVHAQSNGISLADYAGKMIGVFGNNAVIAMCFLIATLFKDVITRVTKNFPILNLFGPKGSGKSEMGHSLTSFFIVKNNPPNLQSTTKAALGEAVAQVSNAIVHLDEYKNSLDIDKIEFLKGLWDGTGRDRMNMDRDKKREMTRVDSGIVLSGQEMPTADIALFSRMIFLTFSVTTHTKEEGNRFKELKRIEANGLTHLTNQMLSYRHKVELDFGNCRDRATADLMQQLGGRPVEDRTLLNWVTPIAAFLCVENELQLPFTYQDVLRIAADGIVDQEAKTRQNNELSGFWVTVENLVRSSKMWIGVDYHVRRLGGKMVITASKSKGMLQPDKTYLQISFSRIAQLYLENGRQTGEKRIPKDSLKYYLEHSAEYRGTMRSVRFKSIDTASGFVAEKQDALTGEVETKMIVTTAMVFDYDLIRENYDINIDISIGAIGEDDESGVTSASDSSISKLF